MRVAVGAVLVQCVAADEALGSGHFNGGEAPREATAPLAPSLLRRLVPRSGAADPGQASVVIDIGGTTIRAEEGFDATVLATSVAHLPGLKADSTADR